MLASSSVLRLPVTATCLCVMGMQRWPRVAVAPQWDTRTLPSSNVPSCRGCWVCLAAPGVESNRVTGRFLFCIFSGRAVCWEVLCCVPHVVAGHANHGKWKPCYC